MRKPNAPRERVIFILWVLNCIDLKNCLKGPANSNDRDTFDEGLPQPANQCLSGFGRSIVRSFNKMCVKRSRKFGLAASRKGGNLIWMRRRF